MALLVLDASVAIAFLDGADAHHGAARAAIARTSLDTRCLPASAYAELLVRAYRRGAEAVEEIDRAISDLAIAVQPIDAQIARRAAALRAEHGPLRIADALVIATGDVLSADVLTADRSWSKVSKRVRLVQDVFSG